MTIENYCMVNTENNVCENICLWDGDLSTWIPPKNFLMLLQSTTPTKIWGLNSDKSEWILVESVGDSSIGFTWDGNFLITNQQKPELPVV